MRQLRGRLRWKISVILSAVLLLVMASLSVGDYLWQRRVFLDDLNSHIADQARTVAVLLRDEQDGRERQRLIAKLARALNQGEQGGRDHELFILDRNAVVQASNLRGFLGEPMASEPVLRVLEGKATYASGVMRHGDHFSFYGVVPFYSGGEKEGLPTGAVHVAEPLEPIQAHLRQFLTQRLFFMGLVTGLLLLVLNLLINRVVLAPLSGLARTIEQVRHGRLDTRIRVRSEDELGQIADAFNAMVQAVQDSQQAIEQERSRLALLYDINRRLASTVDWDALVELIVRVPGEIVDAVGCIFLGLDERTGRLSLEGAWGLEEDYLVGLEQHLRGLTGPSPCLTCRPRQARAGTGCPLLPAHLCRNSGACFLLCLHLAQGEQTVGFLNVYLAHDGPPPPEKVQLLNAVAGEMAAVVAVAQLRARELAVFASLDETVRGRLDLEEMLAQILYQVREASRMAQGAIFLYGEGTERLQPVIFQGTDAESLTAMASLALRAVVRREPLLISEMPVQGRLWQTVNGAACVLAMPLMVEEQVLGAILLADKRPRKFAGRQITLLSAIASQTALIVRNAQLYARLEQQAVLKERERLAREMHDGLAQTLGFLRWQVHQVRGWLSRGEVERVVSQLDALVRVIDEAYTDVREAIDGLRLSLNEAASFTVAVEEYAARFSERTGIAVTLDMEDIPLPPMVQAHLLRVVQEALTNVRKHAGARRVHIAMHNSGRGLTITMVDDGRGFDPTTPLSDHHFGLRIMRERVQGLGGMLEVVTAPGQGTRLEIYLPTPGTRTGVPDECEDTRVGGR